MKKEMLELKKQVKIYVDGCEEEYKNMNFIDRLLERRARKRSFKDVERIQFLKNPKFLNRKQGVVGGKNGRRS